MNKVYALAVLTAVLSGCSLTAAAGRRQIEWPGEASTQLIVPLTEAGAAIAAAAASREMVRTNPYPDLFWGCSSPEQGLDVVVFKDLSSGLYYVSVNQRFNRCGGPRVRVLDGYYEYAVTPQGEVVAEVLLPEEAPVSPPPGPASPEQASPPTAPLPNTRADTPAPAPSLTAPPSAPEAPPPATPAAPPPSPAAPGTPAPAPASPATPSTPAQPPPPPGSAPSTQVMSTLEWYRFG